MEKTRLHIAQVTPGMKLAEPITNAGGTTLMPAGIRLTPMFIARIKKWNIETIDVLVDTIRNESAKDVPAAGGTAVFARHSTSIRRRPDDGGTVAESQEQFARAVAVDVARVFVNVRENPLMMQLRSIVIKRIVAKGPDSPVTALRRGPLDEVPLPLPAVAGEGV